MACTQNEVFHLKCNESHNQIKCAEIKALIELNGDNDKTYTKANKMMVCLSIINFWKQSNLISTCCCTAQ